MYFFSRKFTAMWGSIIGSAIGLGASTYGNIKAGKESKAMSKMIKRKERELDTYYKGELAKNTLDTEYAKSSMKKIREQLDERRKRSDSTAAITGASDEAKVAEKANDSKSISDAVTSLAQYGSQRKDALRRDYMGRKDGIFSARMGVSQGRVQSALNLSNNGWNAIGSAIESTGKTNNASNDNSGKDEKETDNGKKQGFWAKLFSSDISNYQDEIYGKQN